ncbi:MAG TPA: 30S ribosome-binding factor RbfA [Myxococcota bacterium]|jgi:ribosome-binding factor A
MTRRTERIAEQIQSELARVLRAETTDPRIGLVTITRVDVAPDLSHALVFWSALASEDEGERGRVEAGLESASPFLRRRLAQLLPLRRMPALRFRFDPSLALGSQTLRVLREIEDDEPA